MPGSSYLLNYFRYLSIVSVVASAAGAVLMFLVGGVKFLKAWLVYVPGGLDFSDLDTKNYEANSAIAYVAQGIDCSLIALVLMVFASGIYNLAIAKEEHQEDQDKGKTKGMFEINSIGQLKSILAELVIIILFVKFLEVSLKGSETVSWNVIILPAGTLLLAISLKLLDLKKDH